MKNKDVLEKLGIRPVSGGLTRQWIKCNDCGSVYYRDYTAHGLGNPVTWLPCGHDFGKRFFEAITVISETEACRSLPGQMKKRKARSEERTLREAGY